jgi:hypothetical protein
MPTDIQNEREQILLELAERELQSLREPYDKMRHRILLLESIVNEKKGGSQLMLPKKESSRAASESRNLFGKERSPEEEKELVLRIERAEEILRDAAKPMKVASIFEVFMQKGWSIYGKNPKESLRQTLLKHKDKFHHAEGGDFTLAWRSEPSSENGP